MKNKLGIISGLILSLLIVGSVFADTGSKVLKKTNESISAKQMKTKNAKPKKHRKHKRAKRKMVKKVAKNTTSPTPKQ